MGYKPYSCQVCEKGFANKQVIIYAPQNFFSHEMSYTGQMIYLWNGARDL